MSWGLGALTGLPKLPVAAVTASVGLAGLLMLSGCSGGTSAQNGSLALGSRTQTTLHVPRNAPYRTEVAAAAQRYALPPALLLAIIHAESAFDPRAVSHKGAVGLMQVMPATAGWISPGTTRAELFDPARNIEVGARYLRYLADRYGGDAEKILIAWNAGPSRLERGQVPRETRVFVRRVRALYGRYARA